jgi:gluconolactonase
MLFEVPPVAETTVFAELPQAYRTVRDEEWCLGQPGGKLHPVLEGPCFDAAGTFYCTDIPSGRIFRAPPGGGLELFAEYDGWPNGLKVHPDGRILIADHKHGIMALDPQSRTVAPYLVRANLERFKAVNDLTLAANGDLYFTDQGLTGHHDPTGRVFRVRADGTVSCLIDTVPSPNGLVLNADGSALYVAVTRANAVWRLPFLSDGSIAKAGTFIQLSGGAGPDGLALNQDGGLAVAHVGLGTIWIFDAVGRPTQQIRSCRGLTTTNIAYGGDDGRSLFITEADSCSILLARTEVGGRRA